MCRVHGVKLSGRTANAEQSSQKINKYRRIMGVRQCE
jgi:hypothetical protein